MARKDSLRTLTPPFSRRIWVESVVASLVSTALGIVLLAGGHWIPGGILVGAVILGWAGHIPRLWQLYRKRFGPAPPGGKRGH